VRTAPHGRRSPMVRVAEDIADGFFPRYDDFPPTLRKDPCRGPSGPGSRGDSHDRVPVIVGLVRVHHPEPVPRGFSEGGVRRIGRPASAQRHVLSIRRRPGRHGYGSPRACGGAGAGDRFQWPVGSGSVARALAGRAAGAPAESRCLGQAGHDHPGTLAAGHAHHPASGILRKRMVPRGDSRRAHPGLDPG